MIVQNYVGCDVSKQWLDFFDEASGCYRRIDNRAGAIEAHVAGLRGGHDFVVMEATGTHDRLLRHALARAGVGFSRQNPAHIHHHARSAGRRAKTDRLDARMLAGYGRRWQPAADPAPCGKSERLQALASHRDRLVDMRASLKNTLGEAFEAIVAADLEDLIVDLDARIETLEEKIAALIRQDQDAARDYALMVSVPGVSMVTALTLLAHLRELGQRSPKSIAALAGLAPLDHASGSLRRKSNIQGGRPRVRRALYMAALSAVRHCPRFKTFYTSLAARAGSKKLALIAVARKILVILNAIIRDKIAFA